MADSGTTQKRELPPLDAELPQLKRPCQVANPTQQEQDEASYSRASSDETYVTADTSPTPTSSSQGQKSSRPNIYHCTFEGCGKSFNRPCRLDEHIRSHTNERPFSCTYDACTKNFIRQTHLNRHVRDEHENIREHACTWPGCGMTFANATRLKRHFETHKSKFHCTEYPPCRQTFRKHSTLQKHVRSAHLGLKKHQCPHVDLDTGEPCDQAYDSLSSLRAHEGRIHGGIMHYCMQCSDHAYQPIETALGFTTYTALQLHIKEAHPPTCQECNRRLSTHKQLQAHAELAHSGSSLQDRKKFPCPDPGCTSSFTKQGNLNMHVRHVHEKSTKWICGTANINSSKDYIQAWDGQGACGCSFSSKANLEDHIQTQHLGMPSKRKLRKKQERLLNEGIDLDDRTAKKSRSHENGVPISTRLTGVDYAAATGRTIACLFTDCAYRFYRDYDLQVHLGALHNMDVEEAIEAIKERAANEGGSFWFGGLDETMSEPTDEGYMEGQDACDEENWTALQQLRTARDPSRALHDYDMRIREKKD